jgi:hypothetical protein
MTGENIDFNCRLCSVAHADEEKTENAGYGGVGWRMDVKVNRGR